MYSNSNNYNSYSNNSNNDNVKMILLIIIIIGIIPIIYLIKESTTSYSVHFDINGADTISVNNMKCKPDNSGKCFITLPNATRINGDVLGYSTSANQINAEFKVGERIEVQSNMNLYVISKKINKLTIDTSDIDEVKNNNLTCDTYNTSNECEIKVPLFNKLGYKTEGYTLNKGNDDNLIYQGSTIKINNNTILYPVYDEYAVYKKSNKMHFDIKKSLYSNNMYVDIGRNCSDDIVNPFISKLDELFRKYPFLSYNSKISLLGAIEYEKYAREADILHSAGFTNEFEPENPTVLIKCSSELAPYIIAIHELTHVFDVRYKNISGHFLNEEKELIDLRNKYKNLTNRPLREYAYSDSGNNSVPEFLAELVTYYYLNYVDTSYVIVDHAYDRGNFPNDMKKMAEKYVCIGMNNYDINKCK